MTLPDSSLRKPNCSPPLSQFGTTRKFTAQPNPAERRNPTIPTKKLESILPTFQKPHCYLESPKAFQKEKKIQPINTNLHKPQTFVKMSLYAFISTIWNSVSPPPPPKKRVRRPRAFDPDCIEPINHWYHGDRPRQQPRRLVETPTSANWPKFRIAKSVVAKGRKRCEACGALVKEGYSQDGGSGGSGGSGGGSSGNAAPVTVKTVKAVKTARRRKSALLKAAEKREMELELERQVEGEMEMGSARRTLRGRVVEY
jgi:hypothetical protein